MKLAIIIINWNTRDQLVQCLNSIFVNQPSWPFEVWVVDNGSIDGSVEMTRQRFPNVYLIENLENIGFAKANNQAIRLSHGKYILLLNSDAFLTPNAVQKMINVMEADLSIGIAGACLVYPDNRPQVSHGPLPNFWIELCSLYGLDKLDKAKVGQQGYKDTGWVDGACMLIRKTLLDQVGLLDEAFFMFSEEVDLCNRCHKVGAKVVWVESARVIHVRGGSTGQTVQRVMRLYSGKLLYFYKYFGPNAERHLKRMMIMAAMMKGIFYRLLRIMSLGRIQKDEFWWDISKDLRQTNQ